MYLLQINACLDLSCESDLQNVYAFIGALNENDLSFLLIITSH